jgi:hypothetical protein
VLTAVGASPFFKVKIFPGINKPMSKKSREMDQYIREELQTLFENIKEAPQDSPYMAAEYCPLCYVDEYYDDFATAFTSELWSIYKGTDFKGIHDAIEKICEVKFMMLGAAHLLRRMEMTVHDLLEEPTTPKVKNESN